ARPSASDPAATRVSYFRGRDRSRWMTGVASFETVSLGEVWPGISVDVRASGKAVEKIFTVQPGADPSQIRMSVQGGQRLTVDGSGALVVRTGLGDVTFTPPAAFQERAGSRVSVQVAYTVSGQQYGFRLDGYDPRLPVVIDPLLQSTYLGGNAVDFALAIAVHPTSGDVYIAGRTESTNFPTPLGAQPVGHGLPNDGFVAQLNPSLTQLKHATYLAGTFEDQATSLSIDPTSGDVYVAGYTSSADFPGIDANSAQSTLKGTTNTFVAWLSEDLTVLNQSTYLGGTLGGDLAFAIGVHPTSGDVYVAGHTPNSDFPGTTGGAQPTYGGGSGTLD